MGIFRRITAAVVVAVLGLALVGAQPAPDEGRGAVETRLTLLSLGLTDLPAVGDLDGAIGTLRSRAGTVEAPEARLLLEGLRAGGTTLADWQATSTDGPARGGVDLPLDGLGVPGVTGGVSLVDYVAEADEQTATARLAALTGELAAGPLGLAAALGERGVQSRVTATEVNGITEVSIAGLRLQVADLLPAGLLDQLPLGLALELLDELPVDLDAELAAAVDRLDEVLAELDGIVDLDDQRRAVFDELRALFADHPDVVDAEQALADAEALLATAEQAVADAEAALAAALADLADAEALLADAEADLAPAQALVDDLQADVDDLQAQLDVLQADRSLASSLTTATSLTTLLDGLTDLESDYPEADCDPVSSLLGVLTLQGIASCYESHLAGLVSDVDASLTTAQDQLADAVADRDALQQVVDDAAAVVADTEGAVADAQAALADAEALLTDAQAAVADATADLEATLAGLATTDEALALLDRFDELTQQLRDLLDGLPDLLDGLPDLATLRDELAGTIGGTPLFDLGRVAVDVEVRADADGAEATVGCRVADVAVLGRAPLPEIDCGALDTALGEVEGVLAGLLSALPIELPVDVEVGGLQVATSTDEDPAAGTAQATATVSALRARVGSVELTDLVDDLTSRLDGLVDEVLGIVDGLGDLQGALPLGGVQAAAVAPAALTDDLAALDGALDGLPLGGALDGLRTVGLDVAVAGIEADGLFAAAAGGQGPGGPDEAPAPDGGSDGSGGDPSGAGDPGTDGGDPAAGDGGGPEGGDPAQAAPPPDLPSTGGGLALVGVMLAVGAAVLRRP